MANTFITPSVIAARGIATLYNSIVLAGLVWRDFDGDFAGKQGDTVNARKPAVFTATQFDQTARTTTYQDATEDSVPIELDNLSHVPFHVTDEQMTLEISDFQEQLLTPASEALAQKVDADLAEALVDEAINQSQIASQGGGEANDVFRAARAIEGRNKLPLQDRYAVLSPEATSDVLGDDLIIAADKSGSTDGLRNAILGRLLGFETYESQVFGEGAGDRGSADGVAFHKSDITLAVRPLMKPRGVAAEQSAVANYKGLSLRTVYTYDQDRKQDKVVVDVLYGIATTRGEGCVELDFGQGS